MSQNLDKHPATAGIFFVLLHIDLATPTLFRVCGAGLVWFHTLNLKRLSMKGIGMNKEEDDFRMPASICGLTPEEAHEAHWKFDRMQRHYASKLWRNRRRRMTLSRLEFLNICAQEISPKLGLFKALHLLQCERPRLSARRMRMNARDQLLAVQRVSQLIWLVRGFAGTLELENKELISYLNELEGQLRPFLAWQNDKLAQQPA